MTYINPLDPNQPEIPDEEKWPDEVIQDSLDQKLESGQKPDKETKTNTYESLNSVGIDGVFAMAFGGELESKVTLQSYDETMDMKIEPPVEQPEEDQTGKEDAESRQEVEERREYRKKLEPVLRKINQHHQGTTGQPLFADTLDDWDDVQVATQRYLETDDSDPKDLDKIYAFDKILSQDLNDFIALAKEMDVGLADVVDAPEFVVTPSLMERVDMHLQQGKQEIKGVLGDIGVALNKLKEIRLGKATRPNREKALAREFKAGAKAIAAMDGYLDNNNDEGVKDVQDLLETLAEDNPDLEQIEAKLAA